MNKIYLLFFYFLLGTVALASNKINSIELSGNERYNELVYREYMEVKEGDTYNQKIKNDIIKNLFASDLIDNVYVTFKKGVLYVTVEEKKFVSKITFNGAKKLKDNVINENLKLKVKEAFSKKKLNDDIEFVKSFYRTMGYFNMTVDTEVKNLENNLVEVIFNVKEGKKTTISNIYFIGNKKFSASVLKGEIYSRENRFYRFGRRKNYSADMLDYDSYLLRMFYLSQGYVDFKVNSVNAVLNNKNEFDIIFDVDEGELYTFGDVNIVDNANVLENPSDLDYIIDKHIKENKAFNMTTVDLISAEIKKNIEDKFIKINDSVVPSNGKVNVTFIITETEKLYVGKINIKNNFRTSDAVIRGRMTLEEGDPFDEMKLTRSIQRIKNLGFFKNVNYTKSAGLLNNQVDLLLDVEEQSTGSLNFGVGYNSSYGLNGNISVNQRNLFGDAIGTSLSLTLNELYKEYSFGFSKPNILGTKINGSFNAFYQDINNLDNSSSNIGYNTLEHGIRGSIGFDITDYLYTNLGYGFKFEEISDVLPDYTGILSDRDDRISEFSISFSYDKRDSSYYTTSGYLLSYDLSYAGIFGTKDYLRQIVYGAYYKPLYLDKLILKVEGKFGHIMSLNGNKLYPNDGFYLGGYSMRGFESGGIGPRVKITGSSSLDDYGLSGTHMYYFNTELKFPLFLPKEFSLYGIFFFNAGTVTGIENNPEVDKNLILDSGSIRSAAGFSILWQTMMGNISFDFSKVISKEDYDVTENFRFNIGTSF